MSRYKDEQCRICRREGQKLFLKGSRCYSDKCSVTRQTAATYLNSLVDAGLLEFEKVGRESIYKNTRLINLLSKF